jgi:hypothetical protein
LAFTLSCTFFSSLFTASNKFSKRSLEIPPGAGFGSPFSLGFDLCFVCLIALILYSLYPYCLLFAVFRRPFIFFLILVTLFVVSFSYRLLWIFFSIFWPKHNCIAFLHR